MKRRYAAIALGLAVSMVSVNVLPVFAGEEETESTQETEGEEEVDGEEEEFGEEDWMEVIGQITEIGPDYVTIATGILDSEVALGDLDLEALLADTEEEDTGEEIEITVTGGQVLELDGIEETYEVDEDALLYQLAEPYTDIEVAYEDDEESDEELEEELGGEEEIALDPEEEEITISLGDEEEPAETDAPEEGEEEEEGEELEVIPITLDDILLGDIVSISATEDGSLLLTVLQKGSGEEELEEVDLEEALGEESEEE